MSIDLTGVPISSATPSLLEFGGILTPALGGPTQRIDRLGTRWGWQFETAPMLIEPDGRRFSGLLVQARREGALLAVPQPNLAIISPGAPVVAAATTNGRTVPLAGLLPGYSIRRGQWVSIVHAGRRYLDMVAADTTSAPDGTATLSIANLLRTPLASGDVVELAVPKIEGWITGTLSWPVQQDRTTVFSFSIEEAE